MWHKKIMQAGDIQLLQVVRRGSTSDCLAQLDCSVDWTNQPLEGKGQVEVAGQIGAQVGLMIAWAEETLVNQA